MRFVLNVLTVALAAFAGVACSSGSKVEDFTPKGESARKAMEAALNHWQGGGQPGAVPNTTPPVEVTDSKWKSGLKLKSYEIAGEEPPDGNRPRFFKVKLTLATGGVIETKYAVFGNSPLMVFREDDYKVLSGFGK